MARITVPETFRAPCAGPDPAGVLTVGDLAGFSLRQEAALQSCDAKRTGLIALIDATRPPEKRRWWRFRLPDV